MNITKEDILTRIVDLKNLLVFKNGYADIVRIINKQNKGGFQMDVDFEARSACTDLFYYGLLCFPAKGTTFSSEGLHSQLKNFNLTIKPWLNAIGYKTIKEYNKDIRINKKNKKLGMPDILKHYRKYLEAFILALEDDECELYKEFKNNKISNIKKKRILKKYLKLLNSYEDEKIPLGKECKEIRLIIYSMLN